MALVCQEHSTRCTRHGVNDWTRLYHIHWVHHSVLRYDLARSNPQLLTRRSVVYILGLVAQGRAYYHENNRVPDFGIINNPYTNLLE